MSRTETIREWLQQVLHGTEYQLQELVGDASQRRYLRLSAAGQRCIVMDAPPGLEDIGSFLRISRKLAAVGLNVPQVLASAEAQGLALLSDLGDALYLRVLQDAPGVDSSAVDAQPPALTERLYGDAIAALWHMQSRCGSDGLEHYSETLLHQEMCLFGDWLLDTHLRLGSGTRWRRELAPVFRLLLESACEQPQVFVHRDYHARNLMYVPGSNPGILDYQDAVYGPISYDLVSLLKDCYIDWPRAFQHHWLRVYLRQLRQSGTGDEWARIAWGKWLRWFDLMGVQRHLKASGVFARLYHRDGKPAYLDDIPRTLGYIVALQSDYPELEGLCRLLREQVLPRL